MRPHDLLEVAVRIGVCGWLATMPSWVFGDDSDPWGPGGAVLQSVAAVFSVVLLVVIWSVPRVCRWLHDVPASEPRHAAAIPRVEVLRAGLVAIGVWHAGHAFIACGDLALVAAGHGTDWQGAAKWTAIHCAVGAIVLLAADPVARALDGWGVPRRARRAG